MKRKGHRDSALNINKQGFLIVLPLKQTFWENIAQKFTFLLQGQIGKGQSNVLWLPFQNDRNILYSIDCFRINQIEIMEYSEKNSQKRSKLE